MSYPIKIIKLILPITLSVSLIACGGGTEFGDGSNPSTVISTTDITSVQLASFGNLSTDGLNPLILNATAKVGSTAVNNTAIEFNVYSDSAATIVDTYATVSNISNAGATVTAELIPGSPNNRRLFVRAKTGNILSNINAVSVLGTTVSIDGSDAISFGYSADYIIKIKDSSNKAITTGETVTIDSLNKNSISNTSYTTDSKGEVIFTVTADKLGVDTITINALGATITKNITVSGDEFTISGVTKEININTSEKIDLLWKKANLLQDGIINISATRGTLSGQTVDMINGVASFTITSPTAGSTIITAKNSDGLSTTLFREFIATTPSYLNTQAQAASVVPNGSTEIIATITDIDNNPVKNKIVVFNLNDTVNGTLSASTAITDSLGRASVSYTAGNSTSARDGVEITTNVQGYPLVAVKKVFLTVGGDALNISLGSDHLLSVTDVYYTKQIGVIVTDSAGNAVKNQEVTFTAIPTYYFKGQMYVADTNGDGTGDEWQQGGLIDIDEDGVGSPWEQNPDYKLLPGEVRNILPMTVCVTEDTNGNGSLDTLPVALTEDVNGNGLLEPTKDVALNASNSGVTDDTGALVVTIKYLKSRALWSEQKITAKIRGVGTEFKQEISFILPMLTADQANAKSEVPNRYSPYGQAGACTDPN